eukprot:scaffold731_cov261-Pinguiococcus_pyrenoidosus.AAC.8
MTASTSPAGRSTFADEPTQHATTRDNLRSQLAKVICAEARAVEESIDAVVENGFTSLQGGPKIREAILGPRLLMHAQLRQFLCQVCKVRLAVHHERVEEPCPVDALRDPSLKVRMLLWELLSRHRVEVQLWNSGPAFQLLHTLLALQH